jgi:hypothetical protein
MTAEGGFRMKAHNPSSNLVNSDKESGLAVNKSDLGKTHSERRKDPPSKVP